MKRRIAFRMWAASLLALVTLVAPCVAATSLDRAKVGEVGELIERCLPAYVFVGGGSGAVISPDGYVITNAHVTRGSKRWRLQTADGKYHPARVVGSSPGTDLCLLKIDHANDMPYLPLGNSDELEIGDAVIAIGNPFALGSLDGKPTVTFGVISALHVDRPRAYDAVQTDTPINPGNSGGPLINLKGQLIGVNAQIQTRFGLRQNTGVGYAISSNQVKRFLPALEAAEGREVPSGKVGGIVLDALGDRAAVVKDVRAGSPAAEAGVRKGDVVYAMDNAPIEKVADSRGALGRYPIGADITLKVRRPDPPGEHEFALKIAKYGPPYIGVTFLRKSRSSLKIEAVAAGSPAASAGIRKGDAIAGYVIGGRLARPIRSRRAYYLLMRHLRPGMTVPLIVRRGDTNIPVTLIVGERE